MKRSLIFLLVPIFVLSCKQMKQSDTTNEADVVLTWSFQGNNVEEGYYSAAFVLENQSEAALSDEGWALYYNQQGLGLIDESVTGNVSIEHINGDLLKITPKAGFSLEPGASVEIAYRKPGSMLLESESPLHPYMVYENHEDGKSGTIAHVEYSVLPFPSLEKFYPPAMDIVLPDAAWVYELNSQNSLLAYGETGLVIPTPAKEMYSSETLQLSKELQIVFQEGLDREASYLSDMLGNLIGSAPSLKEGTTGGSGIITLRTVSILPVETWANPVKELELPLVFIADKPAFGYRGFMLDIGRNFIEPEDIKKLIRVMAFYKLNKLHLHMTDDEGWRLEIPSLPELTEVGAHRGHTLDGRDHLTPAYGSGPDTNPEGNHGSGYLSRETFIELLQFADAHHVEVIPEINFPGHARAAIYAMESRYDRLMKEGRQEEAEMYRLIDPNDASIYNSAQNFNDNVICVCTEGPYRLFETVVDEVLAMYKEAGLNLKVLHTGRFPREFGPAHLFVRPS